MADFGIAQRLSWAAQQQPKAGALAPPAAGLPTPVSTATPPAPPDPLLEKLKRLTAGPPAEDPGQRAYDTLQRMQAAENAKLARYMALGSAASAPPPVQLTPAIEASPIAAMRRALNQGELAQNPVLRPSAPPLPRGSGKPATVFIGPAPSVSR